MKLATIIMAALLVGCTPVIYPEEHDAAIVACEPFGGVDSFEPSPFNGRSMITTAPSIWDVTAKCRDGTVVEFRRKTFRVEP